VGAGREGVTGQNEPSSGRSACCTSWRSVWMARAGAASEGWPALWLCALRPPPRTPGACSRPARAWQARGGCGAHRRDGHQRGDHQVRGPGELHLAQLRLQLALVLAAHPGRQVLLALRPPGFECAEEAGSSSRGERGRQGRQAGREGAASPCAPAAAALAWTLAPRAPAAGWAGPGRRRAARPAASSAPRSGARACCSGPAACRRRAAGRPSRAGVGRPTVPRGSVTRSATRGPRGAVCGRSDEAER
jgi:hypothetical protein